LALGLLALCKEGDMYSLWAGRVYEYSGFEIKHTGESAPTKLDVIEE